MTLILLVKWEKFTFNCLLRFYEFYFADALHKEGVAEIPNSEMNFELDTVWNILFTKRKTIHY